MLAFDVLAYRLELGRGLQIAVLKKIPQPCLVLSPENKVVVANQPSKFADHPNFDAYVEKEL